jgi:Arc/MetJ-type ribon-helix-helix transcriptional regulator
MIVVSIEPALLRKVDQWIECGRFNSRSEIVEVSVREKLICLSRQRLAAECLTVDPREEQALADEGLMCNSGPSRL